ncbi:MAG: hypothetical protein ACYDB7_00460 [Mycobacteriales bacterium]
MRLLLNAAGDVIGFEVLGWTCRTDAPANVEVSVRAQDSGEILNAEDPIVRALAARGRVDTDPTGRSLHEGHRMISLTEAG